MSDFKNLFILFQKIVTVLTLIKKILADHVSDHSQYYSKDVVINDNKSTFGSPNVNILDSSDLVHQALQEEIYEFVSGSTGTVVFHFKYFW